MKEQGKIGLDSRYIEMLKHSETDDEEKIIDMREKHTYGVKIPVKKEDVAELKRLCQEVIDATRKIVYE